MTDIVDAQMELSAAGRDDLALLVLAEIEALRNERDALQDGVISRDMTIDTLRQRVKELEAENQLAWNTCEKAETREAEAGLAALKAGQEGWQLVPVEPTVDMRKAGNSFAEGVAHETYRAMLSAAPKPGKPA